MKSQPGGFRELEAQKSVVVEFTDESAKVIRQTGKAVGKAVNATVSELEEGFYRGRNFLSSAIMDNGVLAGNEPKPRAGERSTAFFQNMDPNEHAPIVIHELTTTHADLTWRKLGLIRQFGEFRGEAVYYNAKFRQWRSQNTDAVIPYRQMVRGEASVKHRTDEVDGAIIYVLGEIPQNLQAKDIDDSGGDAANSTAKSLEAIQRVSQAIHNEDTSDVAWKDDLMAKIIQQYLTRSLPMAAKKAHGLLFTSPGEGYMAKCLGKGVQYLRDARTGFTGTAEKVQVSLVGVNAYKKPTNFDNNGDPIEEPYEQDFTHHVVLRRSTLCRHKVCFEKGRCSGYIPQNEEEEGGNLLSGGICVCGHEADLHVPQEVVNRYYRAQKWKEQKAAEKKKEEEKPDNDVDNAELESPSPNEEPSLMEVNEYTSTMLECLAAGHDKEIDMKNRYDRRPPDRSQVPVVAVLFGGDYVSMPFRLMQCVNRRWRVLVIEGSGGYADLLCKVLNKVNSVAPDAGVDEYRTFCTAIEPITAEIINTGQLRRIPRGTKAEELLRSIENALKGDEALAKTWALYGCWMLNAKRQEGLYNFYQLSILILSVITTLFTVIQTFLLLLWGSQLESEPPTLPKNSDYRGTFVEILWTLLQWSIIALPIVISLVQGLSNRGNYGAKWVNLRSAAERMLSETYMYRSRTRDYKDEDIKKHHNPLPASSRGQQDWAIYKSREELLQLRAKELNDQLMLSECSEMTMVTYDGVIPPKNILAIGDDGFCDLTPDQYVRFRVECKITEFAELSFERGASIRRMYYLIHTFSALGTLLAAVAAYGTGVAQAWVCFTTAVVNSLTRYMDYSRLEWQHRKYNSVISALANVSSWWASLGARADTKANREQLVQHVEKIIQDEVECWGQQLQTATEKQKNEANEIMEQTKASLEKLKKGEDLAQVKALKQMELDTLTPEQLTEAMLDPTGTAAQKLLNTLQDLGGKLNVQQDDDDKTDEMNLVMEEAKKAYKIQQDESHKTGDAVSAIPTSGGFGTDDVVPASVNAAFVHDVESRRSFLDKIGHSISNSATATHTMDNSRSRHLTITDLCEAASTTEGGKTFVKECVNTRQMFEVIKCLVVEEMFSQLLDVQLPDHTQLKLEMLIDNPNETEDFVSEMLLLSRTEGVMDMTLEAVVELCQSGKVKSKLIMLGSLFPNRKEMALRALLSTGQQLFHATKPICALLEFCLREIADLDMTDLLSRIENRIKVWETVSKTPPISVRLDTLPKSELLVLFPYNIALRFQTKSQIQIVQYYTRMILGTPASRVMSTFAIEFTANLPKALVSSLDLQERFGICSELLTQKDVNVLNKGQIINKMKTSPSYIKTIGAILEEITDFRPLLSRLQAMFSNTYASRIVDQGADEIALVDVRSILDFEDRGLIVEKLREFKRLDVSGSLAEVSKEHLLKLVGYQKLATKLDRLTDSALRQLLSRLCVVETRSWPIKAFMEVRKDFKFLDPKGQFSGVVAQLMDSDMVTRLVTAALSLDKKDLELRVATPSTSKARAGTALAMKEPEMQLLFKMGDSSVLQILQPVAAGAPFELMRFLQVLQTFVDDICLMDLFEAVSTSLEDEYEDDFNEVFYVSPTLRQSFVVFATVCLTKISLEELKRKDKTKILTMLDEHRGSFSGDAYRDLHTALNTLENDIVVQACQQLVLCLRTTVSVRLFYELGRNSKHYDLREMIPDAQNRGMVIPLILTLLHNKSVDLETPILVEQIIETKPFSVADMIGCHVTTINESNPHTAPGEWFTVVLDEMDELASKHRDYRSLVEDFRAFTEPQLRHLIALVRNLCTTTVLGKYYRAEFSRQFDEKTRYLDRDLAFEITITQRTLLDQMIKDIQDELIHDKMRLMSVLDNLDAKRFMMRSAQERTNALSLAVPNSSDSAKSILVEKFTEELLDAYFTQCKSVIRGCAEAKVSAQRRWNEMLAVSVFHGELSSNRKQTLRRALKKNQGEGQL